MSLPGYFGWDQSIFFDKVYLGGRPFTNLNEDAAGPLGWTDPPTALILPTHAATHIVQRPYTGELAPLVASAKVITLSLLADAEADYYWALAVLARGGAVQYCPGIPVVNSFAATSGQMYQLTRPLAAGIIPGVTTSTHPTRFVIDGVSDPSAATVSGRDVTALASGLLDVWYMPVFYVVAQGENSVMSGPGNLSISFTCFEVVS